MHRRRVTPQRLDCVHISGFNNYYYGLLLTRIELPLPESQYKQLLTELLRQKVSYSLMLSPNLMFPLRKIGGLDADKALVAIVVESKDSGFQSRLEFIRKEAIFHTVPISSVNRIKLSADGSELSVTWQDDARHAELLRSTVSQAPWDAKATLLKSDLCFISNQDALDLLVLIQHYIKRGLLGPFVKEQLCLYRGKLQKQVCAVCCELCCAVCSEPCSQL